MDAPPSAPRRKCEAGRRAKKVRASNSWDHFADVHGPVEVDGVSLFGNAAPFALGIWVSTQALSCLGLYQRAIDRAINWLGHGMAFCSSLGRQHPRRTDALLILGST